MQMGQDAGIECGGETKLDCKKNSTVYYFWCREFPAAIQKQSV